MSGKRLKPNMIAVAPYSSDKLHLLHCPEGAIFIVKGISSLERRCLILCLFRRNIREYSNFFKCKEITVGRNSCM